MQAGSHGCWRTYVIHRDGLGAPILDVRNAEAQHLDSEEEDALDRTKIQEMKKGRRRQGTIGGGGRSANIGTYSFQSLFEGRPGLFVYSSADSFDAASAGQPSVYRSHSC